MKSGLQRVIIPVAIFIFCFQSLQAQVKITEKLHLIGDIRFGYFVNETNTRSDDHVSDHEVMFRPRIGFRYRFNKIVEFTARYAGRFTTDNIEFNPGLSTTSENNNGLRMGELAFDQLFLQFSHPNDKITARIGRFQTGFSLPGVITKSIVRVDSPNMNVQWTDGVHLKGILSEEWQADLITQFHFFNAPSNTHRRPLEVNGDHLFLTLLGSLRKSHHHPLFKWTRLNMVLIPDGILQHNGDRKAYISAGVQNVIGMKVDSKRTLEIGKELNYSFKKPSNQTAGIARPAPDKTAGIGAHLSTTIYQILPNQNLGVVLAWTGGAQLTSSDFSNNQWTWEIRHSFDITNHLELETRIRQRGDIKSMAGSLQKENEFVPYIRMTYRL